jgi:cell division protein FtsW
VEESSKFKKFWEVGKNPIDYPLVYTVFILLFFGLGILFSASSVTSQREFNEPYYYLKRQSIWVGISLIAFLVTIFIPFHFYQKYSLFAILFSLFLLVIVFIPGIGKSVETYYGRNFHRWINLGIIQFQPSELAKITVVIYLSSFLAKLRTIRVAGPKVYLYPGLLVGSLLVLIVVEPAFGTTLEILFVILALIFIDGFPIKKLILGIVSLLPLLALLVYNVGYRKKRIDVWLNPYKYRFDEGHQLVSSFRSFAEGGFLGNPLSTGYSHRYLTYSHTDFVLSTFAEDYGFLGILILFSLFLTLITRSFILIRNINNHFGFMLGAGLITMISLQVIINAYVVTGIIPITGISLPFVSYGGSSLLTVMISMGILLNITRKEYLN